MLTQPAAATSSHTAAAPLLKCYPTGLYFTALERRFLSHVKKGATTVIVSSNAFCSLCCKSPAQSSSLLLDTVRGVQTQEEDMVVFPTVVIYGCSPELSGLLENTNHHPALMQACTHSQKSLHWPAFQCKQGEDELQTQQLESELHTAGKMAQSWLFWPGLTHICFLNDIWFRPLWYVALNQTYIHFFFNSHFSFQSTLTDNLIDWQLRRRIKDHNPLCLDYKATSKCSKKQAAVSK